MQTIAHFFVHFFAIFFGAVEITALTLRCEVETRINKRRMKTEQKTKNFYLLFKITRLWNVTII